MMVMNPMIQSNIKKSEKNKSKKLHPRKIDGFQNVEVLLTSKKQKTLRVTPTELMDLQLG